jgi:hypothetical protein
MSARFVGFDAEWRRRAAEFSAWPGPDAFHFYAAEQTIAQCPSVVELLRATLRVPGDVAEFGSRANELTTAEDERAESGQQGSPDIPAKRGRRVRPLPGAEPVTHRARRAGGRARAAEPRRAGAAEGGRPHECPDQIRAVDVFLARHTDRYEVQHLRQSCQPSLALRRP